MPAEFPKSNWINLNKLHALICKLRRCTDGYERIYRIAPTEAKSRFGKVRRKNLAISLENCKFACKQIEWLGFNITSGGTTQLIKKIEAIEKLSAPKTFKQLKNFMGSIHHLTRYIPNLAQAAAALRPLLKTQKRENNLTGQQNTTQLLKYIKFSSWNNTK